MERKGLRKKDMLRIDGVLPASQRLPVCDAVSSASDKRKDKKWSIGGILRRISSIRDYDSSSNDEEIVYCKRTPRKPSRFNRQANQVGEIVLHRIENDPERSKQSRIPSNVRQLTDSPHLHQDSVHSRSSDGSLQEGLGKKNRKNKLKARAEAKRDHLCAGESSSDENSRRSNNSLNKLHGCSADAAQRNNNTCSRRTRTARTERYIKRLSRDDGNGSADALNDQNNARCSLACAEDKERTVHVDANGVYRPSDASLHPRRFGPHSSDRALSAEKSFADLRDREIIGDFRRYSTGQYATDLNRNNAYSKISCDTADAYANDRRAGNFFTYPAKNACHYTEPLDSCAVDRHRLINPDNRPPEPPPRDPRYRVYGYGYGSYPANRHQNVPSYSKREGANVADERARDDCRNFRSYGSNKMDRYDTAEYETEDWPYLGTEFRNSLERTNNKYNSSHHCPIESALCRYRNIRNDQLNCNDANHGASYKAGNKSANICETTPSRPSAASSDWSSRGRSRERGDPLVRKVDNHSENDNRRNDKATTPTDETLERRRSSRNLEEALSELEAIYNSLRLGDEELLDRAERRSMEELSLKQKSRKELDAITAITTDSLDRTKDDMAYRRMHPKERPTSLSDIAGQLTLSKISYLIASPVLSRKDSADDLARFAAYPLRRDEPDITRDDVVFRSINHANNTLRIIDPQPPFGIPLGPVTAATESDYLHTTPTKPEQPRSPYIPQCEPDVVTDDLAYRSLRKDAIAAQRNVLGARENRIDEVGIRTREERQPFSDACGDIGKKRAVRSLSANLYGLINHERIHLRREPSLDAIRDEIRDVTRNLKATPERSAYPRRVVSDGELSDNDAHRRKGPAIENIDINGNHPAVSAHRNKLCVCDTSTPATTTTWESPKKESSIAERDRDIARSSKAAALDDEFWHEYLRVDSNALATDSEHGAETDFTAYSRLCQDLVNLIKGDDDATLTKKSEIGSNDSVMSADRTDDDDSKIKAEMKAVAGSPSNHYSGSERANAKERSEDGNENAELTSTRSLDFYLRVADENVKLIAEAFGSVADHISRSRENSSTSHSLEVEGQSGSTRSSTLYSQEDRTNDNDDEEDQQLVASSRRLEGTISGVTPKRDFPTSNQEDQDDQEGSTSRSTAELDLSRAVRDLQLAAASLCEHGREIEDLGRGRGRIGEGAGAQNATPSGDEGEEDRPIRKLGLIADALRREQERECDQEEATVERGIGERCGENARDEERRRAGERTVCRVLDRARSRVVVDAARSPRLPGVTNISSEIITRCSILLLACLFALLVAILAAT
jgi:hypothetical protein